MPAKIARLTVSARHPVRRPPARKNSSSETIAAVAAKSAQTGLRGRLDLIAQPGQRPEHIGNDGAEQDEEFTEQPEQRSDHRDRLAEIRQLGAAVADTVVESGQQPGGPADAKTFQSAAKQQEECDDGKRNEEQAGIETLGRQPRDQQRQQQQRGENEGQVHPPALGLRIEAVDELAELRLHERPARPDRAPHILLETCGAVLAGPDRIDQQEFHRGNDREPQQQNAADGEQDVDWRIEQPGAQESDKAGGLDRRGALGNQFLADESPGREFALHLAHGPRLRPSRHP